MLLLSTTLTFGWCIGDIITCYMWPAVFMLDIIRSSLQYYRNNLTLVLGFCTFNQATLLAITVLSRFPLKQKLVCLLFLLVFL